VHLVARNFAARFIIKKAEFLRRRNGAPELSPESYTLPCTRETSITSGSSSPPDEALHRAAAAFPMGHGVRPETFIGDAEIVFNRNRQESQMNMSLTAVVLCLAMQTAAAAQCAAPAALSEQARANSAGTDLVKKTSTVVTAPPIAAPRSGGELIKTASAGTHDEIPGLSRGAPVAVAGAQDDEQRHRGGPAMLLAALALMSGIALRRFGAHNQ